MVTYTRNTWVNDEAPVINDTNLNNIATGIAALFEEFDANTILKADADNTPIKLAVEEQRILGRITGGTIAALTAAQVRTLCDVPSTSEAVLDTLFDAYTLLYADVDNTPAALTIAASRLVGRKAAGGIAALTIAEAKTLLAIAIADISDIPGTIANILTDHDKAAHDALSINADTVDSKHASDLQFAQNEEISLGTIPLSVYSPQSVTGVTHTDLKMIDNATSLQFLIIDRPASPSGFTLKGRLYAVLRTSSASHAANAELWNLGDSEQVTNISTITAFTSVERSDLFTLPTDSKLLSVRIWNADGSTTTYCAGAWIEFIAVKD